MAQFVGYSAGYDRRMYKQCEILDLLLGVLDAHWFVLTRSMRLANVCVSSVTLITIKSYSPSGVMHMTALEQNRRETQIAPQRELTAHISHACHWHPITTSCSPCHDSKCPPHSTGRAFPRVCGIYRLQAQWTTRIACPRLSAS